MATFFRLTVRVMVLVSPAIKVNGGLTVVAIKAGSTIFYKIKLSAQTCINREIAKSISIFQVQWEAIKRLGSLYDYVCSAMP